MALSTLPLGGAVLEPGVLYLGRTVERTYSPTLVPCVEGRSSVGRLGISIHATAGFGDVGFNGTWTLEISVIQPVKVYPGMRICQVFFQEPVGELRPYTSSKYQQQHLPRASRMFREFEHLRNKQ